MGGLLHRHPRLHHLSFSRRENWAMGGWGGSFSGGATLLCFEIWGVPSSANLWGAMLLDKNKTIHRRVIIGIFVGLAPGLSCPWQHCSISLDSSTSSSFSSFFSLNLLTVSLLVSSKQSFKLIDTVNINYRISLGDSSSFLDPLGLNISLTMPAK